MEVRPVEVAEEEEEEAGDEREEVGGEVGDVFSSVFVYRSAPFVLEHGSGYS